MLRKSKYISLTHVEVNISLKIYFLLCCISCTSCCLLVNSFFSWSQSDRSYGFSSTCRSIGDGSLVTAKSVWIKGACVLFRLGWLLFHLFACTILLCNNLKGKCINNTKNNNNNNARIIQKRGSAYTLNDKKRYK